MDQPRPLFRVGMLMTGCGLLDGTDPTQAVALQIAIDRKDAQLVACAPDRDQHDVLHPLEATPQPARNALAESARLLRGVCAPLRPSLATSLDALLIPGGLGPVKTLWGVSHGGLDAPVDGAAAELLQELARTGKPIAALDEGVAVVAAALRDPPLRLAGGSSSPLKASLQELGHDVQDVPEGTLVWDSGRRVLSAMTTRDLDVRHVVQTTEAVVERLWEELARPLAG